MVILDTNILSELMKPKPSERVAQWLAQKNCAELGMTSISIVEIYYGLCLLSRGKRRQFLEQAFTQAVLEAFAGRIFPLDEAAAQICGELMAGRKQKGRTLSLADAQIASIALSRGFSLVTRNTRDFKDCGVETFNPFENHL